MTDSQKSDETATGVTEPTAPAEDAADTAAQAGHAPAAPEATASEEGTAEESPVGEDTVDAASVDAASGQDAEGQSGVATAAEPSVPAAAAAPGPRPSAPSPAAFASRPKPAAAAPAAAPVPAAPSTSVAEASKWGRVEGDGHVYLNIDGGEHPVGQYPGVSGDEALIYFARKYDDVVAQIVLLEQRVSSKAPSTDMQKTVTHLREQLAERNMVGDLRAAEARLDKLAVEITELEKAEKAEHDAVRASELAAREAIVTEAEQISGQDPAQTQWKTSSARMNELFENWKAAQKSGVRLGRSNEDALWKRFRAARTVFDRHRRAYFSQLDSNNSAAKAAKEKLIAEAEALSTSTDWGYAAGEYRRLMDQWKASPRASRKDDDALWARFRAAQDVFFTSRQAANDEIDQEYAANLTVKEALLAEANGILPVKDLAAAKKALQSVRDRWEEAGKVPRADMGRIEAGLRKVEDAVRHAEEEQWQRSNPERKARTNSALSQLESAIAGLQEDLAKAEKSGDQRKIKAAREALEARQAWLDQIQRSASELS
ncbi:hypothetical protein J2T22_002349 [Pseudarthrobacter defluvii]|uniref:DUF349 domain-containing protein n=1 Tax=Pseudarthrobacter defluvii TaxID=410837 RepID=A0ABT9UHN5_9MICC|nr:DUF349 domain-containing protein [Pseudarthrobacter defluvii]MDQ0119162.1 hypothetical protein [Pseudarthrobacter defluvii]